MTDQVSTDSPETAEPPEAVPETRSGRRRWLLVGGVVAAVLAITAGAWAIVASQDDASTADRAQIDRMHQGCQEWADSHEGPNGPNDAWCNSMAGWMADRMGPGASAGDGMMAGSMMGHDPASMQATCEQWMATDPGGVPAGADATAWCGDMVEWMDQHLGAWDDHAPGGPMMGGG